MALTDKDPMPWGKYKGDKLIDIPASYLLWIYENNKCSGDLKAYIKDNLDAIKQGK